MFTSSSSNEEVERVDAIESESEPLERCLRMANVCGGGGERNKYRCVWKWIEEGGL